MFQERRLSRRIRRVAALGVEERLDDPHGLGLSWDSKGQVREPTDNCAFHNTNHGNEYGDIRSSSKIIPCGA